MDRPDDQSRDRGDWSCLAGTPETALWRTPPELEQNLSIHHTTLQIELGAKPHDCALV